MSRLPAYARPLADARRRGLVPTGELVAIYVDRWPPERSGFPSVAILPDQEPEHVDLFFVESLDVLIRANHQVTDPERLKRVYRAVLSAKPRRVMAMTDTSEGNVMWLRSVKHGTEVAI